jgi:hypothetical protein
MNTHISQAEIVLYEGRMPLAGRAIALTFGTAFLAFAGWVLFLSVTRHFSIVISLWCVGFGFFGLLALEAATSRGQIRLDTASREIVFVSWALGVSQRPKRFSVSDVRSILVRHVRMLSGAKHKLYFVSNSGERRFVCDLPSYESEEVPQAIAKALAIDIRT